MNLDKKHAMDKKAINSIIKICFTIADLRHGLETEKIIDFKNLLSSGAIIQNKMDSLLSSMNFMQFRNRLLDLILTTVKLLELFDTIDFEFEGKRKAEESLKSIRESLVKLDRQTESYPSGIS